ncbi:MAG: hypothetical protein RBS39_06540 [Phycisphaerales bacterium]|jgi:hypothetical protein|nr:hypothetical protein [Phycisphaerales bacterium]
MASNHRIFISFAAEDTWARDFLVGQARNEYSPFSFVDMSVKEPWSESWKTSCRTKIKGCDGMIAMVSPNTPQAAGALWEISCAKREGVPVLGIHVSEKDRLWILPPECFDVRVVAWTWDNIKNWLGTL